MFEKSILARPRICFWDFDGVIKDSVDVKTHAYYSLFEPFGSQLAEKVRQHHIANGGMSRFDKIPIYLEWAGEEINEFLINQYCELFSAQVLQAVIDSPWVAGVEEYLRNNKYGQIFVLISATPQKELEYILKALDLTKCFSMIYGAPIPKQDSIYNVLLANDIDPNDSLMIGDARADYEAAVSNCVPFLLRRHCSNANLFADYKGALIEDFTKI